LELAGAVLINPRRFGLQTFSDFFTDGKEVVFLGV
jgi:hypothetical protein